MEPNVEFLEKPKINTKDLNYIMNSKEVYANLYEINITKELQLYQYPFTVTPPIGTADIRIREKLSKAAYKKLKAIFEDCFISGDSLYSMKKVDEPKTITCAIYLKGRTEYTMEFNKFESQRTIKQENINKDPLSKQFIEMIIRDILHSNPKLEFYKGVFVLSDKKQKIETDRVSITFYPGFTTSFMETDKGNFLNVTLKNKIIQNDTVLDYINQYKNIKNANVQEDIKEDLRKRSFKVSYAKRNYIIDDIIFDRSPKTQTFNYEGKSINLIEYYKVAHKLKIKNENQPLILVRKKGPQGDPINLYFVPELCSLAGLDDDAIKDGYFMRELAKVTKLEPIDRVNKTNEFLELLSDKDKFKGKKSPKEKSEAYGIIVKPSSQLFTGYYMKETKLIGGGNKAVKSNDRKFPVLEKVNMQNWLCFYEKSNYNDAESLYNNLDQASHAFNFKIAEPEWIEMENRSTAEDWMATADDYFGKGKKRKYDFVIFLLGKNDRIYPKLKKHSLCQNGYVSQVVKAASMKKKGAMSVCSKILLQINAKLGGVSYKAEINKTVGDRKLMIVGVDTSHIKRHGTGVAMVATINNSFTNFYNKEEIVKESDNKKEQLQYCVSSFIEEAVEVFRKENDGEYPKGIIIYRQGVSLEQKEFLKEEVKQIDSTCKTKNMLYYYILVNTKTTFKFFEKSNDEYYNPYSGLLIIDGVTNRNFFEFYIQPQEVTQGSATPTCFHVAFGNLNFPEMIAKLTFDLCHLYSNWQGTVRIPNVIKAAEKLSKMTAKYTMGELHSNLKIGQSYL